MSRTVAAAAICATAMSRGRHEPAAAALRDRRLTRRGLIGAALALAPALPARAEEQLPKWSHVEAAHRSTPNGLFSCAACSFFIKPRSCKVVSGDISPKGWCKLFDLPD